MQVDRATALGSGRTPTLARVQHGLAISARGALLSWCVLAAVAVASGPRPVELGTLAFVLGACTLVPLGCFSVFGLLVAPWIASKRLREPARAQGYSFIAKVLLVEVLLAAGFLALLQWPLPAVVPERFAYRPVIARVVATHTAVVLAFVACVLLLRAPSIRRWLGDSTSTPSVPLWTVLPLHLVARLLTHDDLALVWPGRELALELGSGLFCVLGATRFGQARPPALELRAGIPAMLLLLGVTLVLAAARPSAVDALAELYPGPGRVVSSLRLLSDFDGDGFPGAFGGLDCDDTDPHVNPMAIERVGNGIDDNCMGGDLTRYERPPPARRNADAPRHNLVLVVIDSLRADSLGSGSRPLRMPVLERFSTKAAVFTRAYAHAPYTSESLRSLLSGQYPMNMTMFESWLGSEPNLTYLLRSAGYQTSAVVQFPLRSPLDGLAAKTTPALFHFEHIDTQLSAGNAAFRAITSARTTQLALAELERLEKEGRPFFLWVHYFDPHSEYMPREGTPFGRGSLSDRYRQEVYATDRDLGGLLDALERTDYFDDGYLALTSDHGELLGEEGRYQHALWLDDAVLHVPLLLRGPGIPSGRFDTRVRHVDLFPTLLDRVAGIDAPSQGKHLAGIWSGEERTDRDVIATTSYARATLKRVILRGDFRLEIDVARSKRVLSQRGAGAPTAAAISIDAHPAVAAELERALGAVWDQSMNDSILEQRRTR